MHHHTPYTTWRSINRLASIIKNKIFHWDNNSYIPIVGKDVTFPQISIGKPLLDLPPNALDLRTELRHFPDDWGCLFFIRLFLFQSFKTSQLYQNIIHLFIHFYCIIESYLLNKYTGISCSWRGESSPFSCTETFFLYNI